jgi:hypothetical protein
MAGQVRWLAVATGVVAGLLAGCGSSGPLHSLGSAGHVEIDGGSIPVTPGEVADFTAFVVNTSPSPVVLESASLVPVRGQLAGRLAHVGVSLNYDFPAAGRGWPPSVRTRPLPGTVARPGRQIDIIFGITGAVLGRNYAAAGLKITYRAGGQSYQVVAWSVGVSCVRASILKPWGDSCDAVMIRDVARVNRMAGQ